MNVCTSVSELFLPSSTHNFRVHHCPQDVFLCSGLFQVNYLTSQTSRIFPGYGIPMHKKICIVLRSKEEAKVQVILRPVPILYVGNRNWATRCTTTICRGSMRTLIKTTEVMNFILKSSLIKISHLAGLRKKGIRTKA